MSTPPSIRIRPVTSADLPVITTVEAKSTPNLRYVPHVFDLFMQDPRSPFLVAEIEGEIVACAKFTIVPDGSAWLETLRVIPERQGLGVGKRLYETFFAVAEREGVSTMRMYTGTKNAVSKGLAERFGFQPAQTFYGAQLAVDTTGDSSLATDFQPVTDITRATDLILAHRAQWHDFLVMNRTFYKLSPELCVHLAETGQVYAEIESDSVIVVGARFMPEQALHIGLFGGDAERCLHFAHQLAAARKITQLSCLYPTPAEATTAQLTTAGFTPESSTFIVMEYQQ